MENKFKLGQILCDRHCLKKPAYQRSYYVVIQEETEDKFLVIQPINSNPYFISGASINPINLEDLIEAELKASYLLHQEITVMESFFKEPITSIALGFEGKDRNVMFTSVHDDLIGNIYYEIKCPKNVTMAGYLYYDFHHKEKFNKNK